MISKAAKIAIKFYYAAHYKRVYIHYTIIVSTRQIRGIINLFV